MNHGYRFGLRVYAVDTAAEIEGPLIKRLRSVVALVNDWEREIYAAMKEVSDENRPQPPRRLGGYPNLIRNDASPDLQKYWDQNRPFGLHRIGGYPDYIQHDPKAEAHQIPERLR
jgi:hypothetical protein